MDRRCLLGGLMAGLAQPSAWAQAAPEAGGAPLRLVVPFPPGGSYDVVARLLQPGLASRLRRGVVIENRGGAGGNLGAEAVARAAPDGSTLLLWGDGVLSNAALHRSLPWDPLRDFAPVAMVAVSPVVLSARPGSPPLAGLIAAGLRERRGYSFGTAGNGSPGHIAGALLARLSGVEFQHIPYRGGAPALLDLLAGQIDLASNPLPATLPFLQAGRLAALAVAGDRRALQLPETPAVSELLPGFAVNSWYGVLAPARTPPATVAALAEAFLATAADPAVAASLVSQGFELRTLKPDELGLFMRAEAPRWREMVQLSGAVAE